MLVWLQDTTQVETVGIQTNDLSYRCHTSYLNHSPVLSILILTHIPQIKGQNTSTLIDATGN